MASQVVPLDEQLDQYPRNEKTVSVQLSTILCNLSVQMQLAPTIMIAQKCKSVVMFNDVGEFVRNHLSQPAQMANHSCYANASVSLRNALQIHPPAASLILATSARWNSVTHRERWSTVLKVLLRVKLDEKWPPVFWVSLFQSVRLTVAMSLSNPMKSTPGVLIRMEEK